jgi:hypothetical protein
LRIFYGEPLLSKIIRHDHQAVIFLFETHVLNGFPTILCLKISLIPKLNFMLPHFAVQVIFKFSKTAASQFVPAAWPETYMDHPATPQIRGHYLLSTIYYLPRFAANNFADLDFLLH